MRGRKYVPHLQAMDGGQKGSAKPKARKLLAAPEHLTEAARAIWPVWQAYLVGLGVFQVDFAVALERACELYSDIVDLQQVIRTQGRFYQTTNRTGELMIRPHPAAGQLADTDRRLATYLAEFGLTPAGRAKLLSLKAPEGNRGNSSDEAFFGKT